MAGPSSLHMLHSLCSLSPHQALHSNLMSVNNNSSLDSRSKGPRKIPQKFLPTL